MTQAAQELLDQALQLPEGDRDWMADSLWRSVQHSQTEDDFEPLDPQFAAELERRIVEVREGKVKMVPQEEAMARIRAKFTR